MWTAGRTAKKIFNQPGAFALAVIKQFRANQGILRRVLHAIVIGPSAHPYSDGSLSYRPGRPPSLDPK